VFPRLMTLLLAATVFNRIRKGLQETNAAIAIGGING
jgi:hypothetical protein